MPVLSAPPAPRGAHPCWDLPYRQRSAHTSSRSRRVTRNDRECVGYVRVAACVLLTCAGVRTTAFVKCESCDTHVSRSAGRCRNCSVALRAAGEIGWHRGGPNEWIYHISLGAVSLRAISFELGHSRSVHRMEIATSTPSPAARSQRRAISRER